MKNKKVIFLINTLQGGGAEKVLVNLANNLAGSGFAVTVRTLTGGVNAAALSPRVSYRPLFGSKRRRLNSLLAKCFCKLLPERLQARILLGGDYGLRVGYLEGYPTKMLSAYPGPGPKAAYVHCDLSKGYTLHKVYPGKDACLAAYRALDSVAFVSQVARQGFERTIGPLGNAAVVHNVMDIGDIIAKAREGGGEKYSGGVTRLLAVGRLTAPKSFDRLIRVMKRINDDGLKTELMILGVGGLEAELKAQAAALGCGNIRFLGYDANPYKYMAQADLMVCSSLYEGYSTTTVEAMLVGLPVLTTDCAGMDEILSGGRYGVITPNDEDALYAGLHRLLTQPHELAELKSRVGRRSDELKRNEGLAQNIKFLNNAIKS